jgi:hypothetical protein
MKKNYRYFEKLPSLTKVWFWGGEGRRKKAEGRKGEAAKAVEAWELVLVLGLFDFEDEDEQRC